MLWTELSSIARQSRVIKGILAWRDAEEIRNPWCEEFRNKYKVHRQYFFDISLIASRAQEGPYILKEH